MDLAQRSSTGPPGGALRSVGIHDALPDAGEHQQLRFADVIEEQLAHVGEMLAMCALEELAARRGDARLVAAEIVDGALAGDQTFVLEPVGEPGKAAA